MADKGREDSWIAGLYDGKEEKKEEEQPVEGQFTIPKRRQRLLTPQEREVEQKKYVRMEGTGGNEQERARAAHMSIMTGRGGLEEVEEEEEEQIIEEPVEQPPAPQQQAPVFTRANRGPNLNKRESRRRFTDTDRDLDLDFDWDVPEGVEYARKSPPPPSPSPSAGPPSLGSSPVPETPPPRTIFQPTVYESKQEAVAYDEKLKEINKSEWAEKPLTKWVEGVVVKKTQRAVYKENTEQVQEGLKVVETLTEPPLSKPLSIITTMLPYIVFAISLIVSIIGIIGDEIAQESYNRGPDYSCFTLDIIDLVLLTCNAFLHRTSWFKKKSEDSKERIQKRQQLVDNILAEALLYPSILCSLIGVATDRMWTFNFNIPGAIGHDQRLAIIDVILIAFDLCSLLYVYGSRIYMVYSFMRNLDSMFPEATDQNSRFAITTRIFYTIVLNAILFAFMIIHLALQVYHENLPENKPAQHRLRELSFGEDVEIVYMSYVAGVMLICTIILPIFNIVIFVLANYYYIIELMININLYVVKKQECREKLEEHGGVAKGIMGFAGKNVHATPGRLRDIQSLSTFQRIFFVLREWWIDIIFVVWATMVITYCILFFDYYTKHVTITDYLNATSAQQTFSIVYICSFMVCTSLFALGNYHSFAVVVVTIIIMIPLFVSFGVQAIIDKCCQSTDSQKLKEKDKFAGIVTLIASKDRISPVPSMLAEKAPIPFSNGRPQTVYSNGRPQTVYSTGRPPTIYSTGKTPTVFSVSRPQTVYPDNRRPTAGYSDSPPPTPQSRSKSVQATYVPPSGSRSPLLAVPKRKGNRMQSSASSVVISMTNVEEPELNI